MSVYKTITEYVNEDVEGLKKTNKVKYVFEDGLDGPQLTDQPMYLSADGGKINSRFHKQCPSCSRFVRHDQYIRTASEVRENRIKKKPCNECAAIPNKEEFDRLKRISEGGSIPRPVEEAQAEKVINTVADIEERQQREADLLADEQRRVEAQAYREREKKRVEDIRRAETEERHRAAEEQSLNHEKAVRAEEMRRQAKAAQATRSAPVQERVNPNIQQPTTSHTPRPRAGSQKPEPRKEDTVRPMNNSNVEQGVYRTTPPPPQIEQPTSSQAGWDDVPVKTISSLVDNLYDSEYDPEIDPSPSIGDGWFGEDGILYVVDRYDSDGSIIVKKIGIGDSEGSEDEQEPEESLEYEENDVDDTPEGLKKEHRRDVWALQPVYLSMLVIPSMWAWWVGSSEDIYIYNGPMMFASVVIAWIHCINCTRDGAFNVHGESHSSLSRVLIVGLGVQAVLYIIASIGDVLFG